MADVLLTDLVYDGEKNADGTKSKKRASAGDPVPSGVDKDALREAGVIGNPAEIVATLGSTTSVTQSQEWPEPEQTAQQVNAGPASEEDVKIALRARTDQVSREAGKDPAKVVKDEEAAAAKAQNADDTPKGRREPTIKE